MQSLDILASCILPLQFRVGLVLNGTDRLELAVSGLHLLSQELSDPRTTDLQATLGLQLPLEVPEAQRVHRVTH